MKTLRNIILILIILLNTFFAQWESRTNGLPNDWGVGMAIDALDSNTAVIVINGVYKTNDAGKNWIDISPLGNDGQNGIDVSMIGTYKIWLVTTGYGIAKILHTDDGGLTWSIQFEDSIRTNFINYIEMFDDENGIAMGDGNDPMNDPALFLSTHNGGKTWLSKNDSAFGGWSGDTWRRLDFINVDVGYFYESGINSDQRLYKTIDGCANWEVLNYAGGAQSFKFYNEQIGIIAGTNYDGNNSSKFITRTMDGGKSWENISNIQFVWGNDFEFIPGDPSQIWFLDGLGHGLFYSSDTGKTWVKADYTDIELAGRDIVFTDSKHGWILGDNGILYTNNNGGLITDVKETPLDIIPTTIVLEQNYPNPFNPSTTIKYSIPNVASDFSLKKVSLKIYDVLGNEVAVIVDENKSAGNYEVTFNASEFSSGIYFYKLIANNFNIVKKMIYLK